MLLQPSLLMPNAVLAMGDCSEAPPNEGPEVRPVPAALEGSARFSPVYNLFRNRLEPDLFCAVPEDHPVPTFIEATNWTFAGRTDAVAQGPFDPETARTAVRFKGFYLFTVTLTDYAPPVRLTGEIRAQVESDLALQISGRITDIEGSSLCPSFSVQV